jgi:hypothetical protein
LKISELKKWLWRERHSLQSTEFSFSRFLVPYLMNYTGWALFMDCDMMVRADIAEVFALADDRCAVMATQHPEYTPIGDVKMSGVAQTPYRKKNWSSVMLFNCGHPGCQALTPEYVNTATGLALHQFTWLGDDDLIGEIPLEWNALVGETNYAYSENVKNVHWTLGGPYLDDYFYCDYSEEWRDNLEEMLADQKEGGALRLWGDA